MRYVVSGLSPKPYSHLYGLSEAALAEKGVKRYVAEATSGFPDRIEMRNTYSGESVLLLNHVSVKEDTPYRASHAIFVLEGAETAYRGEDEIPDVMYSRLLSLRGFDNKGMIVDADVARGADIEPLVARLFDNPRVSHINAHYAAFGCYSGRIDRI